MERDLPVGPLVAFLLVVAVGLGVAVLASGASGPSDPDGATVDGQSPQQFQPERVNPETDPETGTIPVDGAADGARILVDRRHDNVVSERSLEPVVEAAFEAGYTVDFTEETFATYDRFDGTLTRYDGILVVQPTSGFAPDERDVFEEYLESGGRVVVLAEPRQLRTNADGSVEEVPFGASRFVGEYGIGVGSGVLYAAADVPNDNNFKSVYAAPSDVGPLTEGVVTVDLDSAGYLVLRNGSEASVRYTAVDGTRSLDTRRQGTYPTVVRDGNLTVVSDASFIERSEVYDADNEVFVGNLLEYLAAGDPLE